MLHHLGCYISVPNSPYSNITIGTIDGYISHTVDAFVSHTSKVCRLVVFPTFDEIVSKDPAELLSYLNSAQLNARLWDGGVFFFFPPGHSPYHNHQNSLMREHLLQKRKKKKVFVISVEVLVNVAASELGKAPIARFSLLCDSR